MPSPDHTRQVSFSSIGSLYGSARNSVQTASVRSSESFISPQEPPPLSARSATFPHAHHIYSSQAAGTARNSASTHSSRNTGPARSSALESFPTLATGPRPRNFSSVSGNTTSASASSFCSPPTTPGGPRLALVSPAYNPLAPRHRVRIPPWDRSVDIVYHAHPRAKNEAGQMRSRRARAFEAAVAFIYRLHGRDRTRGSPRWDALPSSARLDIFDSLIPASFSRHLPIRLTRAHLTCDVWPLRSLQTLKPILDAAEPYTCVSFAFYASLLAAVLVSFPFLAVVSPFLRSDSPLNRLVTRWLPRYGACIQNAVVELDMCRLGWGASGPAELLKWISMMGRMEKTIDLVAGSLQRGAGLAVEGLVVLCRRFSGKRPDGFSEYCPDGAVVPFLGRLVQLSEKVLSLRVAGFSTSLSYRLIHGLFAVPEPQHAWPAQTYRIAPSTIWPRLPGQSSIIDDGSGGAAFHDMHDERNDPAGPGTRRGAVMMPKPVVEGGRTRIPRNELLGITDKRTSVGPGDLQGGTNTEAPAPPPVAAAHAADSGGALGRVVKKKDAVITLKGKESFAKLRRKDTPPANTNTLPKPASNVLRKKLSLGSLASDGAPTPTTTPVPVPTPALSLKTKHPPMPLLGNFDKPLLRRNQPYLPPPHLPPAWAPRADEAPGLKKKSSFQRLRKQLSFDGLPRRVLDDDSPSDQRLALKKKASLPILRGKASAPALRHKISTSTMKHYTPTPPLQTPTLESVSFYAPRVPERRGEWGQRDEQRQNSWSMLRRKVSATVLRKGSRGL